MAVLDRTPSPKESSTVSSEALDRLNCFQDGIDNLVYDMAEKLAKARGSRAAGRPIEIETQDVVKAGEIVLTALRKMVSDGSLPPEMEASIDSMTECLDCKG